MKHFIIKIMAALIAAAACVVSLIPVFILLIGSITGNYELTGYLSGVLKEQGKTYAFLFPSFPEIEGFVELLLFTPEFYVVFWNSVKITFLIVVGQLLFAVPAAWGFARYHGKLSSLLFYTYTILMLLPFQVTMLSNYMVIDGAGMMDTHAALILPAVFSTFPVFIIYRSFIGLPEEIFEAFSLDSDSRLRMFWNMGVPMALPGIKAALLLGMIEYWNMIEQPLLFLETPSLWTFSIYIPGIRYDNVQSIFVISFVVLIPILLIVIWGKDEIRSGIGAMALKEESKCQRRDDTEPGVRDDSME